MKEINELFKRLDIDKDVDGIRLDIADLIVKSLTQKREAFGYWEKAQFAHAIAALAQNVTRGIEIRLGCALSASRMGIYRPTSDPKTTQQETSKSRLSRSIS